MQFEVTMTNTVCRLEQQVLTMSKTAPASKEDKSSIEAAKRFPWKLYQIVKSCKTGAISWDESGRIVLIRPEQFQMEFLDPANSVFKTKNLGSFVRQLNLYGFHKLQSNRVVLDDQQSKKPVVYRFQNDLFIRGRLDLLNKLHRNIGIRKEKRSCKCDSKQNAQESPMNKASGICSKFPMILPSSRRNWSFGLKPSARLTSWIEENCSPSVFGVCCRPQEELVKAEHQQILHESFIQSKLKKASHRGEDDFETKNVTMVKKEDFDEIVSVFTEMLNQDSGVHETSLARMDCSISTAVLDLSSKRTKISQHSEVRLMRRVSETLCPPIHDSSFSFSANASRPIFRVADNHVINAVKMSMVEQNISNQCACMDFENYKENLAHI